MKNEIILFTDGDINIEVQINPEQETVWLTQKQMEECGLYRNPMLCERLAGRTRILLKQKEKQVDFVKYLPVFLKQTIDCIYIRFSTTM